MSRIDFGAAHMLGAVSIVLYGLQRILEIQIADLVGQSYTILGFVGFLGIVIGSYSSIVVFLWIIHRKLGNGGFDFIKNKWGALVGEITLIIGSLLLIVGFSREGVMERLSYLFLGVLVGAAIMLGIRFQVQFRQRRQLLKTDAD